MKPEEQATILANRAYLLNPPDLSNLTYAIKLFGEAKTLDEEQKSLLERAVGDATKAYIPRMPRDETYTRDAVSAYRTLFGEGKLGYDEVDPSEILVSAAIYFRRAEQLKAQASERMPKSNIQAFEREKDKHYRLGLLESQLYFGREMERGRFTDFTELNAETTRIDKELFPGFREIIMTDYVLDGLREAYNLQSIGRIQ